MIDERLIELERSEAARDALEAGAKKLEGYSAGEKYQQAMRLAAKLLRQMKETFVPAMGTDKSGGGAHS